MARVREENSKLRSQIEELEHAPIPIPPPECKRCDHFLEHCQYLEEQLFRKDMVIKSLIEEHECPRTRQLFQETKDWSEEHFQEKGPLFHVGMGDSPL